MLVPDFLMDLHIGSVHSTQGNGAVKHKFHVAGSGGFLAGGGNLFADVSSGEQFLSQRHIIVLQEHHFQFSGRPVILVNEPGYGVDQLDGNFSFPITGRRLAAENKGPGHDIHAGILYQLPVQMIHVQDIQQLPFIHMHPFDLDIEDGVGIYRNISFFKQILCQDFFPFLLHCSQPLTEGSVFAKGLQFPQFFRSMDPVFPDGVTNKLRQLGIRFNQPAAVGHTVGFIVEPFREPGIKRL